MIAVVIVLVVIIAIALLIGLWGVVSYNGLIRLRNLVQEAWRQIDVELTRRHDLIPNLVETVKGYAGHERETLDAVVRARAAATAPGASVAQQAQQEGELSQALGRLMAISEAYPDLKANQNFMALQNELSQTEDRIAAGRRFYNANVRELNTKVESVPSNIIAGFTNIGRADYFEVEDERVRSAPQVNFGQSGPGVSFGQSAPAPGSAEPTRPMEPGAPGYGSPE
ncbi:MAG TPA: LemA family protein [Kineosporiaceae bacterium]|nr:LemA family protein [Kineosporiaceae bacterium]